MILIVFDSVVESVYNGDMCQFLKVRQVHTVLASGGAMIFSEEGQNFLHASCLRKN